MKKTKFISVILALTFLLIGIGYAYWTDTITFGTMVQTGDFNIVFDSSNLNAVNQDDYVNVEVNPLDNHNINISIKNIYPGGGGGISYKIVNKGSIPAVFDSVSYNNLNDPYGLNVDKVLTYSITLQKYNKVGNPVSPCVMANAVYSVNSLVTKFNERLNNWNNTGKPLVLEPGEYLVVSNPEGDSLVAGYFVSMHEDQDKYENAMLSFNLEFKFKQWNAE